MDDVTIGDLVKFAAVVLGIACLILLLAAVIGTAAGIAVLTYRRLV